MFFCNKYKYSAICITDFISKRCLPYSERGHIMSNSKRKNKCDSKRMPKRCLFYNFEKFVNYLCLLLIPVFPLVTFSLSAYYINRKK